MNLKPYPKYKDSGIEWLGKVPEGWEVSYLKNIGRFSARGIDKKIVEGESLVRMVNYMDIYGNDTKLINNERELMTVSCPEWKIAECNLIKGDLVFTPSSETSEDIGLSALITENLTNAVFSYHVVRFRFKKVFNHNFKRYICNNTFVLQQFTKASRGTTRQILDRSDFKNITVVIPPFEEQKRISTFLDQKTTKIDELIKKNERLIELLKEKRQAIISHAVTKGLNPNVKMKDSGIEWIGEMPEGWEVKGIKYVAFVNPEALSENTALDYEIRYVDISNVNEEGLINEPELILFDDAPSRARRIIRKNDVIISTVRTYLKAIAYFPSPDSNLIVSTGFAVLRAFYEVMPKYLYYFVRSEFFVGSIMANSVGVSYPAINSSVLASLSILLPSLKEQIYIVDFLDKETIKIEHLIQKIQSQIEKLKEYRQALISNVVTGKVKVC